MEGHLSKEGIEALLKAMITKPAREKFFNKLEELELKYTAGKINEDEFYSGSDKLFDRYKKSVINSLKF